MNRFRIAVIALLCQLALVTAAEAAYYMRYYLKEHPEGWRRVDKDFTSCHGLEGNLYNLDFKLEPKYYDLFAGLKPGEDRLQRVHLTGWWKLRRIPNTFKPPVFDKKANRWFGGEELPENDIGMKEKFYLPGSDDSQWPYFFVPWDWNRMLVPNWGVKRTGGVGWYRRTFTLGAVPKNHRVMLHFEYVERTSTVWINGTKIGSYETYENHPGGNISRGGSAEQHEYDITDVVKANADNQITVRVFHNGLVLNLPKYLKWQTGGITQACWVDVRPPVYADTIYCTPALKDASVSLRCFLRNALPKRAKLRFRAVVKPWHSYRYAPPVKDVATAVVAFGARNIPPGRSEITLKVALENPARWNHETPFLYHVQVYAAEAGLFRRGPERLIGQARFGFREITLANGQFHINGKRLFLPGWQPNEPYRGDMLLGANIDDWCVKWARSARNANMRYTRWHSGHYPDAFYDAVDEVGIYVCAERLMPLNYADTPEFTASVKRLVDDYYNHPAVIAYSLGNEHYSFGATRDMILKYAPILTKTYELYKRFDTTRPITTCSGSGGVGHLPVEDLDKWPKSDFHDNHDYTGGGAGHPIQLHESIPHWYAIHQKLNPGAVKPYLNGECAYIPGISENVFDPLFKPLPIKGTSPLDLDRRAYAAFFSSFTDPAVKTRGKRYVGWYLSTIGIGTYLEDPAAARRIGYARIIEAFRINGMMQLGYNIHSIDGLMSGFPSYRHRYPADRSRADALLRLFAEKQQPVYAMCHRLGRNCFAGRPLTGRLIVMNDTLGDLADVSLVAAAMRGKAVTAQQTIRIPDFTQACHHTLDLRLDLPADLATGHYRLDLTLNDRQGATLSRNSYPLHLLGGESPAVASQARKVLVYFGQKNEGGGLKQVLDRLGVAYEPTRDFAELEAFDGLLVIGPHALDKQAVERTAAIRAFVQGGGRLLVMCQKRYDADKLVHGLLYRRMSPASTTDVVTLSHPVFRGFERSDFHLWNGDIFCVDIALAPITPAVLAATTLIRTNLSEVGMSVGEVGLGKGVYLFSQIKAVENYGKDSVATRYANQLIRYCVGDAWTGAYAVKVTAEAEKYKKPEPASCFFVNLRPHCNMAFKDDTAGDRKGGWDDFGPKADMRVMPLGRHTFADVPFDIIDPATNKGKSCIVLGDARWRPYLPRRVENIVIGRKLAALYFLVSPTWTPSKQTGLKIATINFHYQRGGHGTTTGVTHDLVVGRNVTDWTHLSSQLPEAEIAFERPHPLWTGRETRNVGALVIPWENPIPEERIETISIVSTGKAIPVFIAITGADAFKTGASSMPTGHWKLDEGSGSTVIDALGHHTNCRIRGPFQWVTGKFGKALKFPGGKWKGQVDIERPRYRPPVGARTSFTLSLWLKMPPGEQPRYPGLITTWMDKLPPNRGYGLLLRGGKDCRVFFAAGVTEAARSDAGLNDGRWHHVAAVYNGATREAVMFVDGARQKLSRKADYLPSTTGIRLGRYYSGTKQQTGGVYNGLMDELRIFDKALSEAEVKALCGAQK